MSACFIKRIVKARKVIKKPNFDYEYKLMSTKTGFKILVYKIMFMWLISNCICFSVAYVIIICTSLYQNLLTLI